MTLPTELRVLGGVSLCRSGDSIPIGGPKAQLLLSILVAHPDSFVSMDRLIDGLWNEDPPKTAVATIQSLVSRLRSALDPDFAISFESGGYRLGTTGGEIDSRRFEALLLQARTGDPAASIDALDSAIHLWHGPAFGPCAEAPDVHGEAVRLDELRLVATDEWAEARMADDDAASMVGELESLVSQHPLRESYWRFLMLALYRTGRQADSLRRANELRKILRSEVGLDLSPAATELEARILANDPTLLSADELGRPKQLSDETRRRLQGATSLIGRDDDLDIVSTAIRDQPLITITGPGGVGKTRLAFQVAGAMVDDFEDGAVVVEFAALRDPSGIAQVIAQALDVQQRQHRTIETTLAEFLAPAQTLLVLDNCEHLTETLAPLVDRLRSACPRLRILATSRHSLGLAAEYIKVLDPLASPPADAVRFSEIEASAAVELFVTRASTTIPGFALTEENALAVAGICRRLDGLPLALELAAARLRTMGLASLSADLDRRIEMLGQMQRGADGRQRTVHELVRWSYDLLNPEEQQVFEQLAVFAGGFDLAAAESVWIQGDRGGSVLSHISSLVDKSMVVLQDAATPRYLLLQPLREFGLDHLRQRGELVAAEDRHARWFVDRAELAAAGMDSAMEAAWSAELLRDNDNYRVAHLTAVARGDAESALRLVDAFREYAFRRVNYEIFSWAQEATAIDGASDHHDHYPTALAICSYGVFVRGDMAQAIELARLAVNLSGQLELSETGLPERVLGNAYFYLGETDEAFYWMDRMQLSARRSGSTARVVHGAYMTSIAYTSIGDGIRGAILAGEARAAAVSGGFPTANAMADYALGLALADSEPAEALTLLQNAARVAEAAGNRWLEGFALTEVYSLSAQQGDLLVALAGYSSVVDTWFRGGDWANQWLSVRRVLGIFVELKEHVSAAVLHGALTAVGAAQAMPIEPGQAVRLSQSVQDVQEELGPAAFADAVRRGTSMQDREIVSFVQEQIEFLIDTRAE